LSAVAANKFIDKFVRAGIRPAPAFILADYTLDIADYSFLPVDYTLDIADWSFLIVNYQNLIVYY
jgi:hypothetical protein